MHAGVEGGSRVVAPAGDSLFFASPKKSKQKKGDPQSATPSRCEGANLRRGGCGVRRRTHCAASQLRSDNCGESVHEAWALRRPCHPTTAPPQAQPAGGWTSGPPTAEQPHGPLLRSAPSRGRKRLALRRLGRAQQWPVWMSDSRVPFTMRRGAQGVGRHGRRSARASCTDSPWLSERRAQRKASSTARPTSEHRRLPAAKRRDAACRVAFSLVTFFWRSKRKPLRRRAHTPASALNPSTPSKPARQAFDKLSPNGWGSRPDLDRSSVRTPSRNQNAIKILAKKA